MNFKKFENIGAFIETERSEERETELFKKIKQISLIYAEKKYHDTKNTNPNYAFSQAIQDFTPIENIILKPVSDWNNFPYQDHQSKINLFLENFYKEVDCLPESEDINLDIISELIEEKTNSLRRYLGVENYQEENDERKKEDKTRLMDFNRVDNVSINVQKKYAILEKIGFNEMDIFIEVHVKPFYKTNEEKFNTEAIKNDLAKIAEHIVDQQPATAAVIGKSWMLDSPLSKEFGFHKIEDPGEKQNDFSAWFQFINKDGQISQERFNAFLKNEELPLKSVKGYIPVEEFLKRYLPQERRGKIILKELNPNRSDFWLKLEKSATTIESSWQESLNSGDSLDDFINKNTVVSELINILSKGSQEKYLAFLRDMYERKIPRSDFKKYRTEEIEKIGEEIDEARRKDLYIEKEVII